jgi:hypothetical protein
MTTVGRKSAVSCFEINGSAYLTDDETLAVLRVLVPCAKEAQDSTAVQAVMMLGLHTGRIVHLAPEEG